MGLFLIRTKKNVEKSEKCIWQKSRQEKYSHNKQLGKLQLHFLEGKKKKEGKTFIV